VFVRLDKLLTLLDPFAQLWDVVDDQDAVDLIKDIEDPQQASDALLRHALQNFSTDNTSVMVIRFAVHPNSISDPHPPTAAPISAGE
jgi:serine/threonine protein phosphatase PrpC